MMSGAEGWRLPPTRGGTPRVLRILCLRVQRNTTNTMSEAIAQSPPKTPGEVVKKMDEWQQERVVEALRALFNIPKHWHYDLVKLKIANTILRSVAREGDLVLRDVRSIGGGYTVIYKDVYIRFDGKEYFVARITLTDDDYEHVPKKVEME